MKYKRGNDKSLEMTPEVLRYISKLITEKDRKVFEAHNKGERAYLHIPYSEGRFLETYAKAIGAKNILEIGTFKGFSTAFLARSGAKVLTIDEDSRYVAETKAFWRILGLEKRIEFKLGLAEKILKEMKPKEKFDMVFIDADKENYRKYTEHALKLLRKGGTILIDNTLWRGLVTEKNPKDNGTKHIRAFNEWISSEFGNSSSIIPAWDGLTVIVKK